MKELQKVTALIKEKQVPVASAGLLRPTEVVARLKKSVTHPVGIHTHTRAWKYYKVRPAPTSDHPERTKSEYCVYDALMKGYGYTEAWVRFLTKKLSDAEEYQRVTGSLP